MVPPKGFTDLAAAYKAPSHTFVNIIGVVVGVMSPRPVPNGANGGYMNTFKLLDKPLQNAVYGYHGLMVRFFQQAETDLPTVREHGDIVLLRHVKMIDYQGQPTAISNFSTGWQVFPADSIPDPSYSIAFHGTQRLQSFGAPADVERMSLEEQAYVIELKSDMKAAVVKVTLQQQADITRKRQLVPMPEAAPPSKRPRSSLFGPKFKQVQDVRHMTFADLAVEVVKKFPNQYGSCELYVTDYTENRAMFYYTAPEEDEGTRDGDEFGYHKPSKRAWPGPWGFHVLKVNLKDPHARFANAKVTEGDLILLQNVKVKAMAAEGSKLEGDMWPEPDNPERIKIRKLADQTTPEIQALLARKELYWEQRKLADEKRQRQQEGAAKKTKAEKKRAKKRRQAEERERAAAAAAKKNQHVRCSYAEVGLTLLRGILDPDNVRHTNTLPGAKTYELPFINAQYRTKARIIGFRPEALEDFAVPCLRDEPGERSPINDMDWEPWNVSQKYEWYFSLLLEDLDNLNSSKHKPAQIWVHVRHEDAQFLLGNDMEDPQDLRSNLQLLTKLREKLCILWGNLEEKKDGEGLSNRPFECCIQEHGIELDDGDPQKSLCPFGWKRMYRMFGATIL